jgi:hypothetical protein
VVVETTEMDVTDVTAKGMATGRTDLHLRHLEVTDTVMTDIVIVRLPTLVVEGTIAVLVRLILTMAYLSLSAHPRMSPTFKSSQTRISTATSSTGSKRRFKPADSLWMSFT